MGSDARPFKDLNASNWREPDKVSTVFVAGGDDWARLVLSQTLSERVPVDVRNLWDVARGLVLYGWFFAPLYAVGNDQLHRVIDAATDHAYRQFGGPSVDDGYVPFQSRIEWLVAQRYIDPSLAGWWMVVKDLRNYLSHPTQLQFGTIHDPLHSLARFKREIETLFGSDEPQFGRAGRPRRRNLEGLPRPPRRMPVGDRNALAARLQDAVERMEAVDDAGCRDEALRLIEDVRDALLGDQPLPSEA